MDCFGTYFIHVQTCNVTRVQSAAQWTASVHTLHMSKKHCYEPDNLRTHGAHKIHSGKTAKDLYLTTCTHGAHKIHSCKNKGVHTAKPFRLYRWGPWPRVQTRPLPLRPWPEPFRVYLRPWPRTIRVYLRPQKARAQPTPWQNDLSNR